MSDTTTQATAPGTPESKANESSDGSQELGQQIEAALLTTDRPLPASKLSELLGKTGNKAVKSAIDELNKIYEQTGRSFRIEEVAGGFQILTLAQYSDVLAAMHKTRGQTKLSPAAMETLAIVAYRQPVLRADIEAIRGVACGEVLRSLMERHMVKIVGRAEELGRPMLYGTTKSFLEVFGLSDLKDLPKVEELKLQQPPEATPPTDAPETTETETPVEANTESQSNEQEEANEESES